MSVALKTFVFGIAVLGSIWSYAQVDPDSTIVLNEVVIERTRIEDLALGHNTLKLDSGIASKSLNGSTADLLRKFGYGHIRSYGQGGLATLSLRGTGASHSSVLWNGLALQSPLNGQLDLSQVPVFLLDDAELQMGGSASINGSGAIGGTLHLNGRARFNEGHSLRGTATGASFNTWFGGIGQSWSGQKFSTDTRVFINTSDNDFSFTNYNLAPPRDETRQHAAYKQSGVLHQDYWQPATNWLLHARIWLQDNFTELPSQSFVFRESESDQRDKFIRSMIGAQFTPGKIHFNFQSSFTHHNLEYRQDLSTPLSVSSFNQFVNSLEATVFSSPELEFTGGFNYTYEQGTAAELAPSDVQRDRLATFGAIKYNYVQRLTTVLSARQESVNGNAMPFAPSFGAEFIASNAVRLTGSVSRNYRIPTMNDLYWRGVGAEGNPALKSEDSWSEEVAVRYKKSFQRHVELSFSVTGFSNQVDNWILWNPVSNVWSPENIKKVWSRGSEANAMLKLAAGKWTNSIGGIYSYTRATTVDVYDAVAENEIGNQLIYTPIHEAGITAGTQWKKWKVNGILNLTGKQYTDSDNNPLLALEAYQVLNFWLQREVGANSLHTTFIIEVNNVLDASYENREGYPMPGRNYRLSLNVNIQKSKTK